MSSFFFAATKEQKLLTQEIPASDDGILSLSEEEAAFDMELLILRRPYG